MTGLHEFGQGSCTEGGSVTLIEKAPAGRRQVQRSILQTLVYADLFDYPLSPDEILRYLTVPASREIVIRTLDDGARNGLVDRANGYVTLPGRLDLVALRERRTVVARAKWQAARRYGRSIARMPFVRMVGVTGTLAVANVEPDDDIDLFVVTAPGRLWLARACAILVVRAAAAAGDEVCPNYFVSEQQLALPDRSFFGAREMSQMVPVYGVGVYQRLRQLNDWVDDYLPQARGRPNALPVVELRRPEQLAKQTAERLLGGRVGDALEAWEMNRKIRKLRQRAAAEGGSVVFTADCCKGHFDHHEAIIEQVFEQRLAAFGLNEEGDDG
jgi:hypothetical protein